ncbi:hypothetical protein ykris0001_42730 [Yersinia kristensenii ATCC 33638]|nr:hypothetical protein ykris0001_42730 [Yersinia kristensenii ATCC 33638]
MLRQSILDGEIDIAKRMLKTLTKATWVNPTIYDDAAATQKLL